MPPSVRVATTVAPGYIVRIHVYFHWGGGGAQKIMYMHAHLECEAQSPLQPGSRALKWALEALGGLDALSCYLSLIFKHSDTKWDFY